MNAQKSPWKLIRFFLIIIIILKCNRLLKEGLQEKNPFTATCSLKGLFFAVSLHTKKKIFHEWDNELAVCYATHLKTSNINQTNSGVETNADHNAGESAVSQDTRLYDLWKKGQVTQNYYKDVVRLGRKKSGRAKAQGELNPATAIKDNKNTSINTSEAKVGLRRSPILCWMQEETQQQRMRKRLRSLMLSLLL